MGDMTVLAQTIQAALDAFQHKQGLWRATFPATYDLVVAALARAQIRFAEWDPERGLYYVDLTPGDNENPTIELILLDFRGPQGSDHYRLEWTQGPVLTGIEMQTHAPGPLPFLPEISPWVEPERLAMSPPLTLAGWAHYLRDLVPQTPPL